MTADVTSISITWGAACDVSRSRRIAKINVSASQTEAAMIATTRCCSSTAGRRRQERSDNGIVEPGSSRPDGSSVVARVLAIKQRIIHDLVLLSDAHTPGRGSHRVDDDGVGDFSHGAVAIENPEEEITVLTPR